jgi:lipopolysaccharide/colanic/teichoic acid biosynthesis glycosyltransferase
MSAPTTPRPATGSVAAGRPPRSVAAAAGGDQPAATAPYPALRYRRKRALDLALGVPLLILAAPVVALLALAIRCLDGGPVLFRQVRLTAGAAPFVLLKLRTVAPDPDADVRWTVPPGAVSGLGAALRRSHLDELPQLVNVLRGEMSLVGPRPERPHFAELFAATVPGYPARYRLPAGITGTAQLRGLCGDTPLIARVVADNEYIERWTLHRDLRILAATAAGAATGCAMTLAAVGRAAARGGGRPWR